MCQMIPGILRLCQRLAAQVTGGIWDTDRSSYFRGTDDSLLAV